ncbi:MAG TPA: hypothetical protein VF707_02690 [Ardenticatenaceae bacterium]
MTDLEVRLHCPECEVAFGKYLGLFISSFATGRRSENPVKGLSGRVLRGTREEDFLTLTDSPERKVIFLMDSTGLSDLVGQDGRGILQCIGYEEHFIDQLLQKGTIFRLVVLPETSVMLATWDNTLNAVQQAYPDWIAKIEQARPALRTHTYEEIMARGGVAAEVRRFLEETINLNRLYTGDGFTRCEDPGTQPSCAEYICLNRPLADFGAFATVEFSV